MNKSSLRLLTLAAIILLFSFPAFGWDETGHKIAAYIAWQQMTPAAREQVIDILLKAPEDSQIATFYLPYNSRSKEPLKREFFMLMATWSDIVRDRSFDNRYKKYHKSNWHYSDTFWTWKDGKAAIVETEEPTGLAMDKIKEFNTLIQSSASAEQKAIAIVWLEHLIGDIHQPMHASAHVTPSNPKGDQGGNLFLLTPKGTPRDKQQNLHSFWDGIIGRNIPNDKDACDADYIGPIAQNIIKMYPADKFKGQLKLDAMDEWQKESVDVAINQAYKDLKWFEKPSDKYKKMALKIAEERLALAGYRMGAVFNRAFGQK